MVGQLSNEFEEWADSIIRFKEEKRNKLERFKLEKKEARDGLDELFRSRYEYFFNCLNKLVLAVGKKGFQITFDDFVPLNRSIFSYVHNDTWNIKIKNKYFLVFKLQQTHSSNLESRHELPSMSISNSTNAGINNHNDLGIVFSEKEFFFVNLGFCEGLNFKRSYSFDEKGISEFLKLLLEYQFIQD